MPVRVWIGTEETTNVSLKEPSVDQTWHADGSEDVADIIVVANATIPTEHLGLYRANWTPTHKGAGFWDIQVHYQKAIVLKAGEFTFTGKTSGKNIHVDHGQGTLHWYTAGGVDGTDAPDFGGLIGVTRDRIEGVDLVGPGYSFTITKKFNASGLATSFLQYLLNIKPAMNDAAFAFVWKGQVFAFAAHELLLQDVNFADAGRELVEDSPYELIEVAYDFEFSKNATDLSIGDAILNVVKDGHDYLWVLSVDGTSNGYFMKTPLAAYVERVYDETDFGSLGISG